MLVARITTYLFLVNVAVGAIFLASAFTFDLFNFTIFALLMNGYSRIFILASAAALGFTNSFAILYEVRHRIREEAAANHFTRNSLQSVLLSLDMLKEEFPLDSPQRSQIGVIETQCAGLVASIESTIQTGGKNLKQKTRLIDILRKRNDDYDEDASGNRNKSAIDEEKGETRKLENERVVP